MSIFSDWFKRLFYKDMPDGLASIVVDLLASDVYKKIAVDSCINLIAGAVSRSEFKRSIKEKR